MHSQIVDISMKKFDAMYSSSYNLTEDLFIFTQILDERKSGHFFGRGRGRADDKMKKSVTSFQRS